MHCCLPLQACASSPDDTLKEVTKDFSQNYSAVMSHWAIQMVVSQCGLPAGSNQLKPACVDQDDQVNSDSQGVLQNCSAATAFPLGSGGTVNLCEDDSVAIALGAPAGWVHAHCPVTCGIPCLSTPLQCVPALDTCDGAVGWFIAKEQACPTEPVEKDGQQHQAHTLASCGNSTACKDFIGSIDDKATAMLKTGLASCAGVPGKESYATYQGHAEYAFLLRLALECGFPASTVRVSGLGTCEGALARLGGLHSSTCPAASCGSSTRCKDYISSIDDYALAKMRTGLHACAFAAVVDLQQAVGYADQLYLMINSVADGCGFPAGTVKATPPGLHTCEGAVLKYSQLWPGNSSFLSGPGVCKQSCNSDVQMCDHSEGTCKTDECEAAIRSIDDQAWACWKKGFQV